MGEDSTEQTNLVPEVAANGEYTALVHHGQVMVRLDPRSAKTVRQTLHPGMLAEVRIKTTK